MEMIVRKAKIEDMPQVLGLIKELAVFEKEPESIVEVTIKELEQAGFETPPRFTCFVAENNGKILGMALIYFRFSTWKGKTIHLEDLIVRQQERGKGIGMMLYKRVMEFAKQENVKRVNWEVLDWNKGAIKFYERTGARVMYDWHPVEFSKQAFENFLEQ